MPMRRIYYTLVLSAVLAGCSISSVIEAERKTGIRDSKTTTSRSDGGDRATQSTPPKIDEYVLTPYTRASWPKTFDKYGDRMPQLERFRRLAAEAAARNSECDKVIASEISDQGTYSSMQFFVDCENMKRFRFSESELTAGNAVAASEESKAYSLSEATTLCRSLIENNVVHPSTLSVNLLDVGYQKFPSTGNVWTKINFKAKNSFGLELKYQAKCIFKPQDPNGEITINERS